MTKCGDCKNFREGDEHTKSGCSKYNIDREGNVEPLKKFCFEKKLDKEIFKFNFKWPFGEIDLKELFKKIFK